MPYTVCALYHFTRLDALEARRDALLHLMQEQSIKGTLLLAEEGINGTVAGSAQAIETLVSTLKADPAFATLVTKESSASEMPFLRSKVKIKKEIVTMGVPDIDPEQHAGTYVTPEEWNTLIDDPNVLVVDTRNDYEVGIGTFKGAINPETETFREFPAFAQEKLADAKKRKIAMFCTGGIRCEKSTAYLKKHGFEEVYHLQGGILKYLEEVPEEDSRWEGECFVFDSRVSVKHGLEEGQYEQCHACRRPITQEDMQHAHYVKGSSCPQCHDATTAEQKQRYADRQKQIELAEKRGIMHMGGDVAK